MEHVRDDAVTGAVTAVVAVVEADVDVAAVVAGADAAAVETTSVGSVTAFASRVTAACARALPFRVAPVFNTIVVWSNIFPLNTPFVPMVV